MSEPLHGNNRVWQAEDCLVTESPTRLQKSNLLYVVFIVHHFAREAKICHLANLIFVQENITSCKILEPNNSKLTREIQNIK